MPDKTLNHAGVTTSTCRHRGRCREPYTADPDNFDRVGILWGSLQTFFSVKLMESRAFKQKSAAFWKRGQNGSKTLIRASNRATNRYFRRTIRAANLLFDARLFYQGFVLGYSIYLIYSSVCVIHSIVVKNSVLGAVFSDTHVVHMYSWFNIMK